MNNQKGLASIIIVLILVAVVGVGILAWQYIEEPKEEGRETINENYCERDADCACGVHIDTGNCFYGNKNYVDTRRQCPDFCYGFAGDLVIKCINNQCVQKLKEVEDETADWKTYKNEEFRFEIEYPADYFISETPNEIMFVHKKWKDVIFTHPYVSIAVFETKYSTDEWVEQEIKGKREEDFGLFEEGCKMHCVSAIAKEIKIGNNIRALQYEVWGVSDGGKYIVAGKGNTSNWLVVIYSHIAGARDPGEESIPTDILDKMLATFRFLE